MTTARDVIAKAICHDEQLEIWADEFLEHFLAGDFLRSPESYEDKLSLVRTVKDAIKDIIEKAFDHPDLQSDSVRHELAALLCPWRPIDTAPKDGTHIFAAVPWLPYPKTLFWAKYANAWRCPASEDANAPYEPTHWMPPPTLPAPPKEDKA